MKFPHIPGVDLSAFEEIYAEMAQTMLRVESLLTEVVVELKVANMIAHRSE